MTTNRGQLFEREFTAGLTPVIAQSLGYTVAWVQPAINLAEQHGSAVAADVATKEIGFNFTPSNR